MKATGIIRRIDDLGRIVIPKEIRRAKRIHENDPLEIFVDDEFILFRKYDIGETPKDILDDFVEAKENPPKRAGKEVMKCKDLLPVGTMSPWLWIFRLRAGFWGKALNGSSKKHAMENSRPRNVATSGELKKINYGFT